LSYWRVDSFRNLALRLPSHHFARFDLADVKRHASGRFNTGSYCRSGAVGNNPIK
jgi:hypothetical protein